MRQWNERSTSNLFFRGIVTGLLLSAGAASAQTAAPAVQFTDVTAAAKIAFKHTSGAAGKKFLPETMGAGVVVFDYDGDGWPDLFFVNSKNWPGAAGPAPVSALYRNNRDGTFADVTKAAGLAVPLYALGGVAADYDNDGLVDLYVTCLGANHLFKNLGHGKFADVTAKAGVGDPGFSTSAAFFDYDKDGRLDLYVANYVAWALDKDLFCTLDGKKKSYCTPESYKGQSGTLYHNRGDGTFEDVTEKAGVKTTSAKALGVAVLDYDGDSWPDLFVANDTQPNRLFRNGGNGTFKDVAMAAGLAFGETGVARAGMGVDAGDWSGKGRPGLVVGNFSNEMIGLYQNEGNGLFVDEAPASGVGPASQLSLTFAAFFFDFDLDGRLDIFAATGHVADDIAVVQPKVTYAQKPHLFRSLGNGRFEDVASRSGAGAPESARRARRRLSRLRPGRRPRPRGHHQQRPGLPAPQRRRQSQQRAAGEDGGDAVESRRHRGPGHGDAGRRRQAVGDREDGLELLLAERAARDLRPRQRGQGRHRGALAERARGPGGRSRGQQRGDGAGGQGRGLDRGLGAEVDGGPSPARAPGASCWRRPQPGPVASARGRQGRARSGRGGLSREQPGRGAARAVSLRGGGRVAAQVGGARPEVRDRAHQPGHRPLLPPGPVRLAAGDGGRDRCWPPPRCSRTTSSA